MNYNLGELAQALFEEAGDALFLFQPNSGRIVEANPTAQKLSGFSAVELATMQTDTLFKAEGSDDMERMHKASRKSGVFHSQEGFLLRHKQDGVWIPVNLTIARLHVGAKVWGLITARDVRERHEAEARLKKTEGELRRVLGSVSDCLWSAEVDNKGRWKSRYFSPVVERITGRPPDFYLPGPERWLGTVHADDRGRVAKAFARITTFRSTHEEEEFRVVRPDGSVRWVRDSVMSTPGPDGWSLKLDGVITDITERKIAEEALRANERRLNHIVETVADGILIVDDSGRITFANAAAERILGLPCGEITKQTIPNTPWKFLSEDGQPVHAEGDFLTSVLASGEARYGLESIVERPDGTRVTVTMSSVPLKDDNDVVASVVLSFTDITQRKRAEEEVRRSEEQYRELFENAGDIIYTHDLTGKVTFINKASERLTGYTREEVLTMNLAKFVAPDHLERAREMTRRKLNGEQTPPYELDIIAKDGRRLTIEVSSRLMYRDGKPVGVQGIYRDTTLRKQAVEKIRASEAKSRSLLENLEQGIFLKDGELRFVAANKPFCQNLGCSEVEIVGKTDFDFHPRTTAEKYRADDLVVLEEGKRVEVEEQGLVAGRLRTQRVLKTPVKDDQGRIVGVLGMIWDVTEQRNLEAQLRQAQKMEAVGQLAGGMAHDFNNLLTAILGNVSLLQAAVAASDPNRDLLAATEKAAWRAAELTKQLLGFSRQSVLRPQPTDVNATIDEIVGLLRRTIDPRITLDIRKAPDLWPTQGDPSQMNQVLMNLCLNSRDAMPQGGRLILETENIVVEEDYARLHLDSRVGQFVRLRVSDTGLGIPPEVRPRIFEPFFTTKEPGKGTGLGLAMVFGIVKQHHGWISCYTEENQGTRFDIYLPRFEQKTAEAPVRPPTGPTGGKETILLADDEAIIRTLGRTILQKHGYQVVLAEDGQQAVDIFQRDKDKIDLVILDMTMPRLSGRDALKQMLHINPDVRVLFSSGYSADQVFEGNQDRVVGFVNKPYRPSELASAVRAALDQDQASRVGSMS